MHLKGGRIRHQYRFRFGGKFRGSAPEMVASPDEVQTRESGTQVGIYEIFQIRPQLLHLAGGATFVEQAQAGFQGVQAILNQSWFQLRHLVRGPAG